jgi:hypothetical protein
MAMSAASSASLMINLAEHVSAEEPDSYFGKRWRERRRT